MSSLSCQEEEGDGGDVTAGSDYCQERGHCSRLCLNMCTLETNGYFLCDIGTFYSCFSGSILISSQARDHCLKWGFSIFKQETTGYFK